jgi:ring-1,2-phenylacetyl-CoA epoxidase subunit PaaD
MVIAMSMTATIQSESPAMDRIWLALETVTDPEIPSLTVVEMGMIADATIADGEVVVRMMPTFAGCPALELIRENIRIAVERAGFSMVRVETVFDPPWNSDRITAEGRRKLKEFGLAPPGKTCSGGTANAGLQSVACPYCDSQDTALESIFGPTLCRAIHYCNSCRQSFEQFKPVS